MKLEMSLPQRPGLIYTMPVLDILVLVLIFPLLASSFSTDAGVSLKLQDTSHRFLEAKNWKSGGPVGVIYRVDKQIPSGFKDRISDMLLEEGYRVYNAGNPASK